MTKNSIIFAILLFIGYTAQAQDKSNYESTLQKMFEVAGTENAYKAAVDQMFSMFKEQEAYSAVNDSIWNELRSDFLKTSINDLTKMLVPVYQKYLTIEDLEDLITFYETPAGAKFAENAGSITQESMSVGQEWGQKIADEFTKRMKEKGY